MARMSRRTSRMECPQAVLRHVPEGSPPLADGGCMNWEKEPRGGGEVRTHCACSPRDSKGVDRSGPTEGGANFRQVVEESEVALLHGFDALDFDGRSYEAHTAAAMTIRWSPRPSSVADWTSPGWMTTSRSSSSGFSSADAGLAGAGGNRFAPVHFLAMLRSVQSGEDRRSLAEGCIGRRAAGTKSGTMEWRRSRNPSATILDAGVRPPSAILLRAGAGDGRCACVGVLPSPSTSTKGSPVNAAMIRPSAPHSNPRPPSGPATHRPVPGTLELGAGLPLAQADAGALHDVDGHVHIELLADPSFWMRLSPVSGGRGHQAGRGGWRVHRPDGSPRAAAARSPRGRGRPPVGRSPQPGSERPPPPCMDAPGAFRRDEGEGASWAAMEENMRMPSSRSPDFGVGSGGVRRRSSGMDPHLGGAEARQRQKAKPG